MVKWGEHRRKIIQKKGEKKRKEKGRERENQINTISSRHSSVRDIKVFN